MNYMVHPEVEYHVQLFSCHLKIVVLKLKKVQKRAVGVIELILYKAQLSRLELFKKGILGMSKSVEVQRWQTGMENKMNWGLSVAPSRSHVQNKVEEALL